MFPKTGFGTTPSSFGSFNAGASTSSPFGGGFKPGGAGAFGAAPTFGAAATPQQPAATGLFGQSNTSGGLFGASTSTAAAPAFGASTSTGFGFGAPQPSGLFSTNTTATPLFGAQTQNTSAFGAKPAGFGFGSTSTAAGTSGVFGAPPATGGLFGQQNTSLGGGMFGNTGGAFGQQQQSGTAHVKYSPVIGTDVVAKGGNTQSVNIKHHCITCMKEYENKSLEELRLEDYLGGRKGGAQPPAFGFQQQTENKPLFGATSAFGQPAATTAPSVFGGGLNTSGFGQQSTFAFGGSTAANTPSSSLFGAPKPAFGAPAQPTTSLFGAASTQAPAFGTTTSTFGFGGGAQQPQQSTGLFGAKPATSSFGAPAPAFGGFGSGGGLFGAKTTAATSFTATPAFGANTSAFGASTSTSGLFGANTFKPAAAPAFGFGSAQPTALGGAGAPGGLGAAMAKPAGTGFPTLGAPAFGQTQQLNFNTGNTTLGGGLGGFGNTSALGGSTLGGFGTTANTSTLGASAGLGAGAGAAGGVHEQILALAARPYGDCPLFKDLVPDSTFLSASSENRATNPALVRAALERGSYRVTSPEPLRVKPTHATSDKKSLFDGLEESDPSLEGVLGLRPSRKRLVLRPKTNVTQPTENRSIEEVTSTQQEVNGSNGETREETDGARRGEGGNIRGINTDLEDSSERHSSWLGSSKLPWNDSKEKPVDNEPTPRIYPDLDKELPNQMSDRRASWLTTIPLRKPQVSNPDAVESSVRELRTEPRTNTDSDDADHLSASEDEAPPPRPARAHPTGVRLTRPGYYTIPSLDDMIAYIRPDGRCVVPHLTIGRKNYGNVFYDCEIDVTGLDLDSLVHFLNKEVIIYPEDADKPPVGAGLNRRAVVTLDRVWPRDKTARTPVTSPERLTKMDYEGKLRRACDKHDTKFIEYRPQTGSWVFRVEHFSKYGLTDSDEEDEVAPDVLRRQLAKQALQTAAPPARPGLGGLGGLSGLGQAAADDSLLAMQQTTLQLLPTQAKAFEMDTEEMSEFRTMYPDSLKESPFSMKSPTSELARLENRQSRSVQLMKASLYNEADMEDDASVTTGDQQVPSVRAPLPAATLPSPAFEQEQQILLTEEEEELPPKPLIVRPHTIVLQYHGKIPPFKETIAGRLGAACVADLAVARARHSRVGFGPSGAMVIPTTASNAQRLPPKADLDRLGDFVGGRGGNDWSPQMLLRMRLGAEPEDTYAPQLDALLAWSTVDAAGPCPALGCGAEPEKRLGLLRAQLEAARTNRSGGTAGVSNEYSYEVWKLCEALWGADLENGGIPGTDEAATVSRHGRLLEWLTAAAADRTDQDLRKPGTADEEDESDTHCSRIWRLLVGGRVLEACKVARQAGDLNLAAILAQAGSDTTFRSLVSRQLQSWAASGASSLVGGWRRRLLRLAAGGAEPYLANEHAVTHILATAKYICPQVPTLEQVVTTYEDHFKKREDGSFHAPDESELSAAVVTQGSSTRAVLELRYSLIKARALNTPPPLHPASYTTNPLDYSLSFLLGAWFGRPSPSSVSGFSAQLQAAGDWHRAVQVQLHHPQHTIRAHLVKETLSRYAPAVATTAREREKLELMDKLKIPREWVLTARAARARYEGRYQLQAELLSEAKRWNEAHQVLLDPLLPTVVLADKLDSIAPLLEKMEEAAQSDNISEWDTRGRALYHYIHVCREIREVVSASSDSERSFAPARLEALRPRLAAACRAAAELPALSVRHLCARAEMGARLLQLSLAAGCPPSGLALQLHALQLPPHTAAAAHHKITTELAERASEECAPAQTELRAYS